MSTEVGFALLTLAPALALLAGYPRRPWGAAFLVAAAAAGGVALAARVEPGLRTRAAVVGLWSMAGGAYGIALCRRAQAERRRGLDAGAATQARREEVARDLDHFKAKGLEAEQEQKETQALYGVIKGLSEAVTWEEIRPKIELAVEQYLRVKDFSLFVADMRGADDFHPLAIKNLVSSVGASWTTLARFLQERGLPASEPHAIENPERAVALPIRENSEILGYFYARVPQGQDPAALLAKAWTFAFEIAFAFRRVKLFQEVERLSRIDGLTGVYRRGDFDEKIQEETIRAKTFKTTYGLMLLDIDHFKSLNDRYGHPFGDQVLRRIGEILNSLVYDTDFVARYGGEEFVILLPRAESAGALRKAEAIRKAIESERFAIALENVPVTVSIGVAHFPRDAATPEELISEADQAMYQAKSQGRNRVVAYSRARA